jgi:hypothetical protein
VTYAVHASKGNDETTTFRLSAIAAVAKARTLASAGWQVYITDPKGIRFLPFEFDELT